MLLDDGGTLSEDGLGAGYMVLFATFRIKLKLVRSYVSEFLLRR